MLGAIIGDIVGSVYEWNNIKTKEFPLFRDDCFFTDDSVMTCAVAEGIMSGGKESDFVHAMQEYGQGYPDAGYGTHFNQWLYEKDPQPYNSCGNGSAMRISPCAWLMSCEEYQKTGVLPIPARNLAYRATVVTHNHPEGIKGAMATTDAIFLCRYYFGGYGEKDFPAGHPGPEDYKKAIRAYITQVYGYDLSRTLDEIRPTYQFDETCQETVPQALTAFFESTDFEDAIRNAISLGGDSDTLAAITGSIAEAAYGIPDWIQEKARSYLDEPLLDVLSRWEKYRAENGMK